jgi:hypothetical protein
MQKIKIAPSWSDEWLEVTGPQPFSDVKMQKLALAVLDGKTDRDISDEIYNNFIEETEYWIKNSKLNDLRGFDRFTRRDVCMGCTQFIDNLYMRNTIQYLEGDYKYHDRLGTGIIRDTNNLEQTTPLVLSMPFPSTGSKYRDMESILDICSRRMIPVHIDGAWITCAKNLDFDFNHPAIKSFAISLSKGLGLGWNRIGVRWSRDINISDSISIMNDYHMNNRALTMIGLHFLKNLPPDYLWNTHGDKNTKICSAFNLIPTNSIHLALRKDGSPVGLTPLLRYLEGEEIG